jgi:hypothetical protein
MNRNTAIIAAILALIAAIIGFLLLPTAPPDSNVPNIPIPDNSLRACSLFTQADAQQLIGVDAKEIESAGDSSIGKVDVTHCEYASSSGSAAIFIRRTQSLGDARYIFENSRKSFNGEEINPSVGDREYWVSDLGQYNILKDNHWIIVTVDKDKEKAKTAADIVASRL